MFARGNSRNKLPGSPAAPVHVASPAHAPPPPPATRHPSQSALVQTIAAGVKPVISMSGPVVNVVLGLLMNVVGPVYMYLFDVLVMGYETLPIDIIKAAMGLGLCFFGGAYATSIAAFEAFTMTGWETTKGCLLDIRDQMVSVRAASAAADKKDGGSADESTSALVERKVKLSLLAIKEPEKLSLALGGLYAGWLAVHATLKIKFAQTVTLALSITESLDPIIMRVGVPVLQAAATTTQQRRRRRPQQHTSFSRAVGRARRVPPLAADARARRGKDRRRLDRMVPPGRRVRVPVGAQGWPPLLAIAPTVGQRAWDTWADEVCGYALAGLGLYTQWTYGFALLFPYNLIMAPFTAVEWYIRWSVTYV